MKGNEGFATFLKRMAAMERRHSNVSDNSSTSAIAWVEEFLQRSKRLKYIEIINFNPQNTKGFFSQYYANFLWIEKSKPYTTNPLDALRAPSRQTKQFALEEMSEPQQTS